MAYMVKGLENVLDWGCVVLQPLDHDDHVALTLWASDAPREGGCHERRRGLGK